MFERRAPRIFPFIAILALVVLESALGQPKIFCVYGSWSSHQTGKIKFTTKDIKASLCDYLIYAYAELSSGGGLVVSGDPQNELNSESGTYAKIREIKLKNPKLKTLIGIGGHNVPSSKFSRISAIPRVRNGLAIAAAEFARFHGFDGIALAWYYPGQSNANDKDNFSQLLKVMGQRLRGYGLEMGVFISPIQREIELGYVLSDIGIYSDWVFPLTFDYHGPWENKVRHFAPIYGEANNLYEVSIASTIKLLEEGGIPSQKIILGIGTFGRSYTLLNAEKHQLGDQSVGPGLPGKYTKEAGFLAYNEICEKLYVSPVVFETTNRTVEGPYTHYRNQWASFEDETSVARKANFVKNRDLGGMFLWTMDTDDFRGWCRTGEYPLHVAANNGFGKNISTLFDLFMI